MCAIASFKYVLQVEHQGLSAWLGNRPGAGSGACQPNISHALHYHPTTIRQTFLCRNSQNRLRNVLEDL